MAIFAGTQPVAAQQQVLETQVRTIQLELIQQLLAQVEVLQKQLNARLLAENKPGLGSDINTPASIKVLYPNGGEKLGIGQVYQFKWSSTGLSPKDTVYLYLMDSSGKLQSAPFARTINSGTYWVLLNNTKEFPIGSYKLHIGTLPTGVAANSKIMANTSDTSDNVFEIVASAGDAGGTGTTSTSGPGYCGEYYNGVDRAVPTDPAFTAYGLRKVEVPLSEANRSNAYFKLLDNPSYVPTFRDPIDVILPGYHLRGRNAGSYLTIPITFLAGKQFNLLWYENQDPMLSSANVVVSLSPCPGDFRPSIPRNNTGDKYLNGACRYRGSPTPGGSHSATIEGSGLAGCQIPAGKTMYLNITNHKLPHSPVNASCQNGVCTPGETITTPKPLCTDESKPCGMRFDGLPFSDGVNFR